MTIPNVVSIENHGSVVLLRPLSDEARLWIDENVQTEGWQWFGDAFAVEPRYVEPLVRGLLESLA